MDSHFKKVKNIKKFSDEVRLTVKDLCREDEVRKDVNTSPLLGNESLPKLLESITAKYG